LIGGKTTFQENPGPGKYENCDAINKNGKQYFSKYKSSCATIINPRSKRFANDRPLTPGPNHYQTIN